MMFFERLKEKQDKKKEEKELEQDRMRAHYVAEVKKLSNEELLEEYEDYAMRGPAVAVYDIEHMTDGAIRQEVREAEILRRMQQSSSAGYGVSLV